MNPTVELVLNQMLHSEVGNYVIPGLQSALVGGRGYGCVRLFDNSRRHQEQITPHSHRFDFACLVLEGIVTNRIWRETENEEEGDLFQASDLIYGGECGGKYLDQQSREVAHWTYTEIDYGRGHWYTMTAEQVHSIDFSRGARVLFFEGPSKSLRTTILEPFVDGKVVPTFEVKPWMFKR